MIRRVAQFEHPAHAVGTLAVMGLLIACLLAAVPAAAATPPQLLWQTPADGQGGTGPERMEFPRGVAASPVTGDVFVAESESARVSRFTAWGEFVEAWGFGVKPGVPGLDSCTIGTGCQRGTVGDAPGQMDAPVGVAVDSAGNVYVYDNFKLRITKYSEDGDFLLMFGGNVNKTTGAEICTQADVEAGDECGAGEPGSAAGFFENGNFSDYIELSADGSTIFVGNRGRIQEFDLDGTFKSEIPFTGTEPGELGFLADVSVHSLAVDPLSGDLYISTNSQEGLYRISPAGELVEQVVDTIEVNGAPKNFPQVPAGLAVDSSGAVYVVDHRQTFGFDGPFEILKFGPDGKCLICGQKFAQPDALFSNGRALRGLATSSACGIPGDDLYVVVEKGSEISQLQSYGPPPQDTVACPPPKVAPDIEDQYALDVGTEDAEVAAVINPRFWSDTTYYVQYGPQGCLDSDWTSGCSEAPLPPGETLTDKVLNGPVRIPGLRLESLEPDTVYHYRFVAQSTGGGPVFGVGGTEGSDGTSSSFHTFPAPLAGPTCPNDDFRTGLGVFLPDCRAYEMVSPVDKDGGEIATENSINNFPVELGLAAPDGEIATYSSSTAFADAVSSPYASQYLAKRDPVAGWQTHAISPPREELFRPAGKAEQFELDLQFKLFSPDLSQAWLMQEADPPLDDCGVEDYINWYRRDNSSDGYEAITTKEPATKGTLTYFSEVQGASEDGTRTIFRANDQLLALDSEPAAAGITGYQLYEHVAEPGGCGQTHLVSVLPDNTARAGESSVGTAAIGTSGAGFIEARQNLVHNAVSADGSRIYWTAAGEGPGVLYVRANASQTIKVSTGSSARFWHAADDGSVAYYTEGETLKRFAFPGPTSTTIATQVIGLVGASEDASRVYFVSKASIGGQGSAGNPNLYLFDEGTTEFIATLSIEDVAGGATPSVTNPNPAARLASVSADGGEIAFTSNQSLTGADNLDRDQGLPASEAFLYEADSGELHCVSCNFSGAMPRGEFLEASTGTKVSFAGRIPPWKNQFHAPRVISADGSRVSFESRERLVGRDTNGAQDVYMWTRAEDEAACAAIGAELYNPVAGGCISLISAGAGASGDSEFVDATADFADVFFKTPASLVAADPNRVDLYDARVGGGFPSSAPPDPCLDPADCPPIDPGQQAPGIGSDSGQPNPDFSPCQKLEAKAAKLRAQAGKLKKKAVRANASGARKLKAKAKAKQKQARRLGARARGCYASLGGR